MGILRDFRRTADALERVASTITAATKRHYDSDAMMERLNELERDRTMWEADVEALLMKAEGKLKAAANSEARERHQRQKYEDLIGGFDPEGQGVVQEDGAAVQPGDVEGSETEGMHVMSVGMAPNKKAHALRAKWMI